MIVIRYTDGTEIATRPEQWSGLRGDGVDEIVVSLPDGRSQSFAGHSLYWHYREGESLVFGEGSLCGLSDSPPYEMVVHPGGEYQVRRVASFPDLPHDAVKLGWWR